jgi:hypothetical protein
MSNLRVNKITNVNDDGKVEFAKGVTLPLNQTITESAIVINSSGIVTSTSLSVNNDVTVSGIITASFFVGNGFNLTNVPGTPNGKAVAYALIR